MRIITLLRNINELIMFKHTIFALPFIGIVLCLGVREMQAVPTVTIILAILCATFARSFAMGFNRLIDRDIDGKNPRTVTRPSVDGRMSPFLQNILIGSYSLGFVVCAYFINELAFWLSFAVLVLLASYSYMKRFTYLAHIVLGLCLASAPLAGDIALNATVNLSSIWLGLGVLFWVAGFDILYSLQDREFDKQNKLHSIPACFGVTKSIYIVHFFHIIAGIFWVLFVREVQLGMVGQIGLGVCLVLLVYENILVRQSLDNINRAFFTLNGWISILFFVAVSLDILLIEGAIK